MAEKGPEAQEGKEAQKRISNAIDLAVRYGGIDGDHHKMWVIDQMVRELTGCPIVSKGGIDTRGESEEYRELIREAREGDDGPETYDWDTGTAP